MYKVADLMTTDVVTLCMHDSVQHASDVMSQGDFRHLPILNERKKLVGLVSHRDLLRFGVSHMIVDHERRQATLNRKMRLHHIMTSPVHTVHPDDSLRACGLLMLHHHYGCLPVVANDRLVGILTDTDFVSMAVRFIEAQDFSEEEHVVAMDTRLRSRVH